MEEEAIHKKKKKKIMIKEESPAKPQIVKGKYKKSTGTKKGAAKKVRKVKKKQNEEEENKETSEEEEKEDILISDSSEEEEEEKKPTKKRKMETVVEETEEEDEEEDDEEVEQRIVVVKKEILKEKKPKKPTKRIYPSCVTRSSPKAMYDAMVGLTEMRKKCLKDIGFERFINFPITELPGALLYYVVDKFHPTSMELRLEQGSIKITKQIIHDMIGVPMGKMKLEDLEKRDADDPFIAEWESQYSNVAKITPAAISTEITSTFDADFIFTINFLTLFASTMGTVDNGGKVYRTVVEHVKENDVISDIDWCGYILECLRTSRQNWEKVKKGDFYYGPATFLCVSYFKNFYKFIIYDSISYDYYNLTQVYLFV